MAHTREVAKSVEADRLLFYDKIISLDDEWSETYFIKDLQESGDLGDRMKEAFYRALSQHKKAVIIGSDCPQISPELINSAYEKLDIADIVLGPTLDGGYYLLGMQIPHDFLSVSYTHLTLPTKRIV